MRIKIFLVRWLRGLIKMIYVKDMVQRQAVGRLLFPSSYVPRSGGECGNEVRGEEAVNILREGYF